MPWTPVNLPSTRRGYPECLNPDFMVERMPDSDELLTIPETMAWLKVSRNCLAEWRRHGRGPTWLRLSHREIRYRVSDLESFLAESEVRAKAC